MAHFVYILGRGSRWGDHELRYSLRSLAKNFKDVSAVTIVGHCPPWVKNAEHIACNDIGGNPIVNVCHKILYALDGLPDEFVLMNDDHYLLRPLDEIPLWHGGAMYERLKTVQLAGSLYANAFRATYAVLRELHIENPLRYDLHVPFPMTREGILELSAAWPSGRFLFKTLYGNLNPRPGVHQYDVKARLPVPGALYWSSPTNLGPDARRFLVRSFRERSPYEKP